MTRPLADEERTSRIFGRSILDNCALRMSVFIAMHLHHCQRETERVVLHSHFDTLWCDARVLGLIQGPQN